MLDAHPMVFQFSFSSIGVNHKMVPTFIVLHETMPGALPSQIGLLGLVGLPDKDHRAQHKISKNAPHKAAKLDYTFSALRLKT